MQNNKSYYAIIPANVRYDNDLPANAKLLYGEITALCNQNGFCWAENSYFMSLYGVGETTIRRWLKSLIQKGYIYRNIRYAEDGKTVENRCLSIVPNGGRSNQNWTEGGLKNGGTPPSKNGRYNNTDINITVNNTNNNPPSPPISKKDKLKIILKESDLAPNIKKALEKWLEYKKYNYEGIGFKTLLSIVKNKIELYGEEPVIELIDECISNTWKGIIWDKLNKDKGSSYKKNQDNGSFIDDVRAMIIGDG